MYNTDYLVGLSMGSVKWGEYFGKGILASVQPVLEDDWMEARTTSVQDFDKGPNCDD